MYKKIRQSKENVGKSSTVKVGNFSQHWNPKDYLNEYYSANFPLLADEVEAVRFQVKMLKNLKGKPVVLEFGCGPTAHRAIAVAPYVTEIHVADFVHENLEELKRWVEKKEDSHSWNHYINYILQCEGVKSPTQRQITTRERMTQKKITKFLQADAGEANPLGLNCRSRYKHVYSGFCADSATHDKRTWARYVRNIISLVAPGGTFFMGALRNAKYYKSGGMYFPSANVNENDIKSVLAVDFIPSSIIIEVKELPSLASEGYSGIVLAHAIKKTLVVNNRQNK